MKSYLKTYVLILFCLSFPIAVGKMKNEKIKKKKTNRIFIYSFPATNNERQPHPRLGAEIPGKPLCTQSLSCPAPDVIFA